MSASVFIISTFRRITRTKMFFLLLLLVTSPTIVAQQLNIAFDTVCASSQTHLKAVTDIKDSDIVSYKWDFGNNGTIEATGKEIVYTKQSNNTVRLEVNTLANTYSHTRQIVFHDDPLALYALPNGCEGEAFVFYDYSFSTDGLIVKYKWDYNSDGITESEVKGNTSYTFPNHGIFKSTLKVETEYGCSSTFTKAVVVLEKPKAFFNISNTCLGDSTIFKNRSEYIQDSVKQMIWDFGDRNSKESFSKQITHLYISNGVFPASLEIIYKNGCADKYKQNILTQPPLEFLLTFSPDTIIYIDKPVTVQLINPYDSALWSTGEITRQIIISNPGFYNVRIIKGSCVHTQNFNIIKLDNLPDFRFESSILTLNGDGINDRLIIKNFEAFGKCRINVYDGRGVLVYSNKDYQNDWNLEANGNLLESGGYFYEIRTESGVFRGSFSILR